MKASMLILITAMLQACASFDDGTTTLPNDYFDHMTECQTTWHAISAEWIDHTKVVPHSIDLIRKDISDDQQTVLSKITNDIWSRQVNAGIIDQLELSQMFMDAAAPYVPQRCKSRLWLESSFRNLDGSSPDGVYANLKFAAPANVRDDVTKFYSWFFNEIVYKKDHKAHKK